MALLLKNTRELINPDKYRAKILVYGMSGSGKTSFLGTAPKPLIGACETGQGKGLLSIASLGLPYTDLDNYNDFQAFASGAFTRKCEADGLKVETEGLDSLSDMNRTFIKDYALTLPRRGVESDKRKIGIPELDDYGSIAELTRKNLRQLLDHDKHLIVTATMRFDKPDPESGQNEMIVGPDLPGQMFLGSMAMFDIVLCLKLKKTAEGMTRVFLTEAQGAYQAKSRLTLYDAKGKVVQLSVLDKEEPFNPATGKGTFPVLLAKVQQKYADWYKQQ